MPAAQSSVELAQVRSLATQLEAYESSFVGAVREFLAQARGFDLIAVASPSQAPKTRDAIDALQERVAALRQICARIDALLAEIRHATT